MELPDMRPLAESVTRYLPQLLYASVEEAARTHRRRIDQNVEFFRVEPQGLDTRLAELAQEWDVDRILGVAASGGSLVGFWLSLTRGRMWLLLPLVLSAGALHHGLTGASPAIDLLRRMGIRTREEIESEMIALHDLRASLRPAPKT